jgi:hypothetical protein
MQFRTHESDLQYIDSLRLGDLRLFKEIERESGDWWFPTLDRGSGACLHFAVDHGQVTLSSHIKYFRLFSLHLDDWHGHGCGFFGNLYPRTPPPLPGYNTLCIMSVTPIN